MKRTVQLYIDGKRVELFQDEQIQINSSIQNVNDISKTYTDFSQSFSVPASPYNNAIFQHFYQSDVNSTIDHNIRRDAFIEIDLAFFRRGKVQLDGAKMKNGQPESYSLTFYGDGKTLLDYFGEDLLSDLDHTIVNHEYSGTEVKNRIDDGNDYDVKYPLISSKRIWTYSGITPTTITPAWLNISTSSSNDIASTSGHIHYTELFPAVRVYSIFKLIEAKYGVFFNGLFLQDDRFQKLYLYYKNKNEFFFFCEPQTIDFDTVTTSSNIATDSIDVANNSINVQYQYDSALTNADHQIIINVNSISSPTGAVLEVYQNGNLYQSIPFSTTGNLTTITFPNVAGLNDIYTFKVKTHTAVTINVDISYQIIGYSGGSYTVAYGNTTCYDNTLVVNTDLASMTPQMKVGEFFGGIIKMFNMVCYGTAENTYQIEPLDDWYSQGAIVDISQFTDVTSIDVDRMKLYKKISMSYQPSESFLNKQFTQLWNRDYGNTSYQYNYDGDEFAITVPFENLLQNKFTGSNLQVGYCLNNEFAPYIPKPMLLYAYDNLDATFKFNDGSSTSTITTYTPFGQDLYTNLTDYTLNFAPDISTILNEPVQQTLFGSYYFSYLYNLYNLKQRIIKVKTILPIGILTGLKLNDRVIIRDKRYIINNMNSNLATGDVEFELILDFRPMQNLTQNPYVGVDGGNIQLQISFVNDANSAMITSSNADVIISPDLIDSSQIVTVTLPSGSAGTVYPIDIRYTLNNGNTNNQTINILQK